MFIFTLSLEEFPVCGPERPNDLIRRTRLNGKKQTPQPDVFPQPWPSDKNHTEICKTSKYAAPHASNIFRHNSQEGEEKKRKKRKKKQTYRYWKQCFSLSYFKIGVRRMQWLPTPFLSPSVTLTGTCEISMCMLIIFMCKCTQYQVCEEFTWGILYTYCVHI